MQFHGLELDPFQEQAIQAVDAGKTVIVAAPTGAGKTVIAEYAIEKHLAEGRKVIYTAPIKALSNQKFRDFSRDYPGKIGIMTGDVILNPDAPVLIMTTEIFRNIIFDEGGERLKDIRGVILDEIHYIDDAERGTVWEECLIFAPDHIQFICLSATIPNLGVFAEWMSQVRGCKVETVVETRRPVPLKVNLFVPRHGVRKLDYVEKLQAPPKEIRRGRRRVDNRELISYLRRNDQLPCLYFVFSRVGCREYALRCATMELISNRESGELLDAFDQLVEQFQIARAPGVETFRRLLQAGVAYHHAGVLPAMKEIIERLYTMGLIKLLFTTETFAVGINMPARSVVFDSTLKYDGISLRPLRAREFHQMAGRAGRRGIDPVGFAYPIVIPGDFQVDDLRHMLSPGNVEHIESQFALSYSSILNLYDKFGNLIFEVCERSFAGFTAAATVKEFEGRMLNLDERVEKLRETRCVHGRFEHIADYSAKRREFNRMKFSKGHKRPENAARLAALREEFRKMPCDKCGKIKSCRETLNQINDLVRENDSLSASSDTIRDFHKTALARRIKILKRMGYMDDKKLLPRGAVAARIFGYELQFTELYFNGFFEERTPEEINVAASAVVHESRRLASYRKVEDKKLKRILATAAEMVKDIQELEREEGSPTQVKPLDYGLAKGMLEWCRGCDFDALKNFTTEDDGDIVRSFRLTVDFLRQMRRAIPDKPFQEKLRACIDLIYRDVVDAEAQLRTEI